MPLPTFICIGAQKSGTTTLHSILERHPDIYLPGTKETKYFCDGSVFNRGIGFYEREFFTGVEGETVKSRYYCKVINPDFFVICDRRNRKCYSTTQCAGDQFGRAAQISTLCITSGNRK